MSYLLPVATTTVLGGVKQGSGVSIAGDGTLSAAASGGSVTSVALTMPAEFTVTGSPVTTAGTLTAAKANQNANQVYAGPSSGGAAAPAFRALVAADIPRPPWQNWTPTVTGPGTVSGLVINSARYQQDGPTVYFYTWLRFTLGGAAGSQINISPPVAFTPSLLVTTAITAYLYVGGAGWEGAFAIVSQTGVYFAVQRLGATNFPLQEIQMILTGLYTP